MIGALVLSHSLESTVPRQSETDASPDRAIWRGMLAVAAFVLLAKLAAAAKEVVVAWRFGVGSTTDAYMFLYTLASWPVGVWTSILPALVLPLLAGLRARRSPDAEGFQGQLLGLTIVLGAVASGLGAVGMFGVIESGASGLSPEAVRIARELVPALALSVGVGMVTAIYATWTMSEGKHLNTLSEGMPAVGILLTVLIVGSASAWAWGTVAGMVGQTALLWFALGRSGRIRPAFRLDSTEWSFFARGMTVMLAGQLMISLTTVADQFFAARLGEGAVSVLGYANRSLSLGLTLVATAIGRATLPVFSRLSAESESGSLPDAVVRRWTFGVFGGALVAGLAGWVIAPPVVALLFERGEFTALHTQQVAEVMRYGMLQLPFYSAALVLVSSSASRGCYDVLLATGVAGLTVKILANFALIKVLSVNALMVSTAAVQAVNLSILWWGRKGGRK